jgi:PAS domain S-box-containing protein
MNAFVRKVTALAGKLSPAAAVILAAGYVAGMGLLDDVLPERVRATVFYMPGIIFAGWRAGKKAALFLSLLAALIIASQDWAFIAAGRQELWISLWNTFSALLLIASTGWLAAEGARLARRLHAFVERRTARWKLEAREQAATSARLTETLERIKQVTDNISEVTWLRDVQKERIIFVNPGYEKTWGKTSEELCREPRSWLESVHPDDRPRVELEQLRQERGVYDTEYRIIRPGGEVRWIHDRAFPVRDAAGKVYRLVGIARDITEAKRTESLLHAERDVGTSLSQTSDLDSALGRLLEIAVRIEGVDCGGIYLFDLENGELQMGAHLNLTEEFVKQVNRFSPSEMEAQLVLSGRPAYRLYSNLTTRESKEGLRALAVVPLVHEGKVLGCINLASHEHDQIPPLTRGTIEAIAKQASGAVARLRAEEALRKSEARLRAVITGAPLVVFTGDRQGPLTFLEGQALRAIQAGRGTSEHHALTEVFGNYPGVTENVERVLSGEEFSTTIEIGALVFECWFSPTRDREGRVSGFTGVATNVTERQHLQRQILEISDREQARIGQDIHDGLCQQLVSLAFDANALERRLSQERHPETPTAGRLASLLDNAITESRQLSRGLFPIRLDAEGLPSALEELARNMEDRFGIVCELHCAEPVLIKDHATATHLYRIAQEAINNAIKHGHARQIDLYLRSDPEHVELKIDDDGSGFNPGEAQQSSGMGLHIMNYRARTMGGNLKVSNRSAGGASIACQVRG